MKSRWVWIVIAANLVVLLALVFVFPHLMVSPGPLMKGHAALATDCFACHAPLRGASTERCVACHALPDIGLRTTQGVPIRTVVAGRANPLKMSFHQELMEQDCMACHSDHAGPKLTQRSRKPFSHELLREATRNSCASCHAAPDNNLHRRAGASADCAQCHTSTAWKPATFDHDKLFVLDRDHDAPCETCHKGNDYRGYTCYGCHEHTPAKVRREHVEEGIRDFENCVECHRSADGKPQRRGGGAGQDKPRSRERD